MVTVSAVSATRRRGRTVMPRRRCRVMVTGRRSNYYRSGSHHYRSRSGDYLYRSGGNHTNRGRGRRNYYRSRSGRHHHRRRRGRCNYYWSRSGCHHYRSRGDNGFDQPHDPGGQRQTVIAITTTVMMMRFSGSFRGCCKYEDRTCQTNQHLFHNSHLSVNGYCFDTFKDVCFQSY